MSHKTFGNDLVAIRKKKMTLTLNKSAYTDTLMYEIKTEDVYEDFSNVKKCLNLVIIQLTQNIMIIQIN